ncbi:hypothetical protein [Leptolyngbya iicbica]|uniref:Uncharacterized protein n=2 Tax=Cyanophyceae TaxID=3028117 RepID=A0A4Q7EER0_9CYAN|nr:hypothetical protein [Leptolyngbya sp. LK]RZM81715.1 hypothetical protein DYY88_00015 [Leptolyngbya sp. LK]
MHTWALFSCSSLITLTAYNLTHLPKTAKSAPEPVPDPSDQVSESAKFSLDTMSGQFPEFEQIARPPLPDQPQLARKIDEPPGYNPALYDPAQYPVREVDLVGGLPAGLPGGITYRVDAIAPLPTPFPPPPSVNPFPLAASSSVAIAPRPQAVNSPRPERAATTPSFAPRSAPAPAAPAATPRVPPKVTPAPAAPATEVAAINNAPELFAALPDEIEIAPPADLPAPAVPPAAPPEIAMTDVVTYDPLAAMAAPEAVISESATPSLADLPPVTPAATPIATVPLAPVATTSVTTPAPTLSMELAPTRHDLLDRYCDRPLAETSTSTRAAVCDAGTSE